MALRLLKSGALPAALAALSTSGCGATVPSMMITGDHDHATAYFVNKVVDHVKSEIGCAVTRVIDYDKQVAAQNKSKRRIAWLDGWSAKMQLKLTVDEKTTLTPGASLTALLPNAATHVGGATITTPQSFSMGLGGQLSSDATRIDTSDYTFDLASDFLHNSQYAGNSPTCSKYTGVLTDGDLQIYDFLDSRTFPYEISTNAGATQNVDLKAPSTLQTDITFVVAASGNVTPTWKFVAVTANTNNPLLNSGRTQTDDILLTLGPTAPGGGASQALTDAHNIGKQNSGFSSALYGHQQQ